MSDNIFRRIFGLDKNEDKITPESFKPAESHIFNLDESNKASRIKNLDSDILSILGSYVRAKSKCRLRSI